MGCGVREDPRATAEREGQPVYRSSRQVTQFETSVVGQPEAEAEDEIS